MTAGSALDDSSSESGSHGELMVERKTIARLEGVSEFEVGSGDKPYGRALNSNHDSGWLCSFG
jgi:hypothetical protein